MAKGCMRNITDTSFSILFARYKNLGPLVKGAVTLAFILLLVIRCAISEGVPTHRQYNDIGTVKLPGWMKQYTGVEPEFHFTSGPGFPMI